MDETIGRLSARWRALGEVGSVFCRPWLDLDARSARYRLDPRGVLGDVTNHDVLCLASGGGQQSAAFGVLGARVTVLDLDAAQLQRDREAARHYGISVRIQQGDMRDLSRFGDASFDIVWHPYSVNLVPEFETVVRAASRVLRRHGVYMLMIANPFTAGVGTRNWTGHGYEVRDPYVDGAAYEVEDEAWVHDRGAEVPTSVEYRHTLGTVVQTLTAARLRLFRLDEDRSPSLDAVPGTWSHLTSVIPPWLSLWARKDG